MENHRLFQWRLLPLWLGLALMFAPFLSIWRVGVLSSFYLESGSLLMALLFVLMSVIMFWGQPFSGSLKRTLPPAGGYFLVLAIFWAVQARVMDLPYVGLSDMVAWAFVVYALLAWACRGWVRFYGQETVVSVLAWVMVVACVLQGVVAWLQYTGAAAQFSGYLMYRAGIVEGQLGQYNHLGHFMMWGILAAGYLWGVGRMRWWLALPILLFLTATTGIITSRALIAYMMAMALLLPAWRVWSGRAANRLVLCLGVAVGGVLLFQFVLEPLLHLFSDNLNINSSLERLGGHSHNESGRSYEWKKAWLVFLSAPIWGYGWGGFPSASFQLEDNIYTRGFRLYDPNVLFTHSHNSYLNLLAEMGLVGTILVLGGLLYLVSGCLKAKNAPSLFLLTVLTVSLTHSVLEYPLWYLYFFTIFAVFLMLMPTEWSGESSGSLKKQWAGQTWATGAVVGVMALAISVGILRLAVVYNQMVQASKLNETTEKRTKQIMHMLMVSRTEPMLAHYADLILINFTHTNQKEVASWADLAQKSIAFRPYAHAYKHGLLLYRQGKTDEAKQWLEYTYRYYPHQMSLYGNEIMLTDYYHGLREQYTNHCQAYREANSQAPMCAEALPPKVEFDNISNN